MAGGTKPVGVHVGLEGSFVDPGDISSVAVTTASIPGVGGEMPQAILLRISRLKAVYLRIMLP
jgi:hypothetical protein